MSTSDTNVESIPGFYFVEDAAAAGDPYALWKLANFYLVGEGVERNPVRAFQMFEKASRMGSRTAMRSVAVCYRDGTGVTCDLEKSLHFFPARIRYRHLSGLILLPHWFIGHRFVFRTGRGPQRNRSKAHV